MFEYIKGKIIEIDPNKVVVDVNGIGYKIFIPSSIYSDLLSKQEAFLHLSYIVKEDSHTLYGFLTKLQREIFDLLLSVSGVGAKTAILLLGSLDIENLHLAVVNNDTKLISTVPGIGKKTAERLIVELKDKFKNLGKKFANTSFAKNNFTITDAIGALINLGYSTNIAQRAVNEAIKKANDKLPIGDLITLALKNI